MAYKKITDLTDIGTPDDNDLLEIVDISAGESKRVKFSEFSGGSVIETKNKIVTITLSDLSVSTFEEVTYTILSSYVTFLNITINKGENYYFEVVEFVEEEVVNYNFDITANSSPTWDAIISAEMFNTILGARGYNSTVENFIREGQRIRCNVSTSGSSLELSNLEITNVIRCGNISTPLTYIGFGSNTRPLIDEQVVLPNTLTTINLSSNGYTLSDYSSLENWANNLPVFTNECTVLLNGNTDSITGTNLETILLTKNTTITP